MTARTALGEGGGPGFFKTKVKKGCGGGFLHQEKKGSSGGVSPTNPRKLKRKTPVKVNNGSNGGKGLGEKKKGGNCLGSF